jgi:regulatory protein
MHMVTAIKAQKGQRERVNVFLDGDFAFSLSRPTASEARVHEGQTLSIADIDNLKSADLFHRSLNSAVRYLSPRPRSESEIKARLRRNGVGTDTIDKVLDRLRAQGLVNDTAFAQFWRENRENFRPRSRRLIELELKRKGVADETVAETTAAVDDEINAYHAAERKARSLNRLDYASFRRRLGAFLRRRGFSFELIDNTVDQVWQELVKSQPDL